MNDKPEQPKGSLVELVGQLKTVATTKIDKEKPKDTVKDANGKRIILGE